MLPEKNPTWKTRRHKTLEERAAEYGGRLGPYTEYDWGEQAGKEMSDMLSEHEVWKTPPE